MKQCADCTMLLMMSMPAVFSKEDLFNFHPGTIFFTHSFILKITGNRHTAKILMHFPK